MMLDFDTAIVVISADDPEQGYGFASSLPRKGLFTMAWTLVAGNHLEKFEGCLRAAQQRLEELCKGG